MTNSLSFLAGVAVVWLTIGVVLAVVMGRRGYNSFGWLVLGVVLGPLSLVLAFDASRHSEHLRPVSLTQPQTVSPGPGLVDVLVGYDGSVESVAAFNAVAQLFGDRLGRLTVATVSSYGDVRSEERRAKERLQALAGRPGHAFDLEVLHGHPSVALSRRAMEGGFDIIAVGTRGAGISKAIVGSAATELARQSKIPVLLVGQGAEVGAAAAG